MKLGRVVGTVVSTRKNERIEGLRLYVVRDLSVELALKGSFVVAADTVGAGVGEVVLYASGSSARQTKYTDKKPVDAAIMAIVDTIDFDGQAARLRQGPRGVRRAGGCRKSRPEASRERLHPRPQPDRRPRAAGARAPAAGREPGPAGHDVPDPPSRRLRLRGRRRRCGTPGPRAARGDPAREAAGDHRQHPPALRRPRSAPWPRWPWRRPASGGSRTRSRRTCSSSTRPPAWRSSSPQAWTGDDGLSLARVRTPFGVIGSITPCTNPTETILNNGIGMVAGGNAVCLQRAPRPPSVVSAYVHRPHQPAPAMEVGGPENLMTCVAQPTIASAGSGADEAQGDVNMVVVTGGGAGS